MKTAKKEKRPSDIAWTLTGSWQGRRRGLVFWRLAEFKGLSPGNGDGQEVRDTPERGVGGKMIDKIKGKYRLICDICGEAAEEVFSTFTP